jgi:predicted DNA-binding protein
MENWAVRKRKIYETHIMIRLPLSIKERLEKIARSKGITVSDFVRLAIQKALQQEGSLE